MIEKIDNYLDEINNQSNNTEIEILTTEDIAKILKCSKTMVRKLYRKDDFPVILIGKNYKVYKDAFIEWMKKRHI